VPRVLPYRLVPRSVVVRRRMDLPFGTVADRFAHTLRGVVRGEVVLEQARPLRAFERDFDPCLAETLFEILRPEVVERARLVDTVQFELIALGTDELVAAVTVVARCPFLEELFRLLDRSLELLHPVLGVVRSPRGIQRALNP